MATRQSLGARAQLAMEHVNEVIEAHAPGHVEKMRALTVTGTPPVRTTNPEEITRVMVYQAEQMASLADLVDRLAKEAAPKKRRSNSHLADLCEMRANFACGPHQFLARNDPNKPQRTQSNRTITQQNQRSRSITCRS